MDGRKFYSFFSKPSVNYTLTFLMLIDFFLLMTHTYVNGIKDCSSSDIVNISLSGIAMVITIILFFNVGQDKIRVQKSTSLFQLNLLCIFFALSNEYLCWMYPSNTKFSTKYILDSNIYLFDCIQMILYKKYLFSTLTFKNKFYKFANISINIFFWGTLLLVITNPFTKIFFYYENGIYTRSKYFSLFFVYTFYTLFMNILIVTFFTKMNIKKKISFYLYTFIFIIQYLFHMNKYGLIFNDIAFFISFVIIYTNVQVEERVELIKSKIQLANAQTEVMISQIQPHFLYNSLATISALCDLDPELAQNATDRFSNYLRMNLHSIKCKDNIPFEKELEHIQTYLWLEQLRFDSRLKVEYKISFTDFFVPPLSIQPIVENAVKHGILNKNDGGTVILISRKIQNFYEIIIKDDGIGFDINSINDDGKTHIGIKSVSERIEIMLHGTIKIDSKIGKGTIVTIRIPKN